MTALRSFVQRHPLATFVVLAYLFSWLSIPLLGGPLGMGPLFAALLIVALTEGRAGLAAWGRRSFKPTSRMGWYALAAGLPILFTSVAAGVSIWLGAPPPAEVNWSELLVLLPVMLLFGGALEEPGWTGYALPRLLDRWGGAPLGVLFATLIMATIRFSWHLPLMLGGEVPWSDIVWMIGAQIVFAWLFLRSGGSALTILLLHLMNNTFSGEFVGSFFSGADSARYSWVIAALWCALALGVLLVSGPRLGLPAASTPRAVDSQETRRRLEPSSRG